MTRLWHYTCDHGATGIRRDGFIRPNPNPFLGAALAWFTDLNPPDREALGLTSTMLHCDRLAHSFEVDSEAVQPWIEARRDLLRTAKKFVLTLESAPGAMPAHWYVSTVPVPVVSCLTGNGP
jgi:hypothetical protein